MESSVQLSTQMCIYSMTDYTMVGQVYTAVARSLQSFTAAQPLVLGPVPVHRSFGSQLDTVKKFTSVFNESTVKADTGRLVQKRLAISALQDKRVAEMWLNVTAAIRYE